MKLSDFVFVSNTDPKTMHKLPTALDNNAVHKDDFTLSNLLEKMIRRVRYLVAWGTRITPYRVFNLQGVPTYSSDFSSRLDVLREVASWVYYELYVDGNGNVHYHPQRFVNDYLTADAIYRLPASGEDTVHQNKWPGVQVLSPEELFNQNTTLNFEELLTFLKLRGQDPHVPNLESDLGNIVGSSVHRKYLSRFGYRRTLVNNPLFNINFSLIKSSDKNKKDTSALTFGDLAAASLLIYANGDLHTKEATMVFRPELELAKPAYFVEDNSVFYINSIDHNITIGGDATTTINASFGRKDYDLPADLSSFIRQTQIAYILQEAGVPIDPEAVLASLPAVHWESYLRDEAAEAFKQNWANITTVRPEIAQEL
jgi:hypothetical protein